ncbi:MAG: type I-E CRISPR-associated protein Cas5/CasD [Proteobacteria bacterium]|nr:type I-E CRISPR-associated protein Cas5/CasD [Pseudomonadota bacterium]
MRWMHLRFCAPMASFGGEAIDAHGVTRDFPVRSMLTGFLANALGWDRSMRQEHQSMQDRIVFGALCEHEYTSIKMTDYQTAQLGKNDKGWTVRGEPSGRKGGADTFAGSHQRWRDYHSDLRTSVVLRLTPEEHSPTLTELQAALVSPARPLFIGRKSCLPTDMIFHGWVEGENTYTAILAAIKALKKNNAPLSGIGNSKELRAVWPAEEGDGGSYRTEAVSDERNWISGLHGGSRQMCEGLISLEG